MNKALWRNPRILSTLLFVFLAGAMAGAVVMRVGYHPERHHVAPYWNEGGKEISIQRFRRELNLNPAQSAELETVLDDFMTYYQSVEAQLNDVRATGKRRILRILNDDQRQKFERMLVEAKQGR